MKTLLLVRHAKSDWDDPSLNDIDRPLNDRGKKDAPEMAKRLRGKNIKIDAFISSPAKRAKKTASIFAKEYDAKKKRLIFFEDLYLAEENAFFNVIQKTDDKFDSIAIFSHNPGITDFANLLTNTRIDNIPTCGVFAVSVDTEHWSDFTEAKKDFLFFDFPKSESLPQS